MDVERTVQFLLDRQAQAEAEIQQIRSVLISVATVHAESARRLERLERVVADTAEIQRQAEEERLKAEEQRLRAEEANRQAHLRYEEAHRRFEQAHRETEERFNALIRMMDEWIRERRRNKHSE